MLPWQTAVSRSRDISLIRTDASFAGQGVTSLVIPAQGAKGLLAKKEQPASLFLSPVRAELHRLIRSQRYVNQATGRQCTVNEEEGQLAGCPGGEAAKNQGGSKSRVEKGFLPPPSYGTSLRRRQSIHELISPRTRVNCPGGGWRT